MVARGFKALRTLALEYPPWRYSHVSSVLLAYDLWQLSLDSLRVLRILLGNLGVLCTLAGALASLFKMATKSPLRPVRESETLATFGTLERALETFIGR